MPMRTAHARWEGSVKIGKGEIDFGNGLFRSDYSFGSRSETGAGTNPEELLGEAHASCFAMALSLILGERASRRTTLTQPLTSRSGRRAGASKSPRVTSCARPRCRVSIEPPL
jgi:osmotically inducible protein OsmC